MKRSLLKGIGVAILNGLTASAILIGASMWMQILEGYQFGSASSPSSVHTTVVSPSPTPNANASEEIGDAVAGYIDPVTGATVMVVIR